MSTERDELRGTLSNTICNTSNFPERAVPYLLGGDMSEVLDKTADAILAAGYRKPRTITTAEELEALGVGSVVVEASGDLCQRFGSGWAGIIQEPDGELWLMRGAEDLELPATVLHGSDNEPSDTNWGDQAGAVL